MTTGQPAPPSASSVGSAAGNSSNGVALALRLLEDARFDALLGPATPFEELPAALPALLAEGGAGCPVATYAQGPACSA